MIKRTAKEGMLMVEELFHMGREVVGAAHSLSEAGGREAEDLNFNHEVRIEGSHVITLKDAIASGKIPQSRVPYYERKYRISLT